MFRSRQAVLVAFLASIAAGALLTPVTLAGAEPASTPDSAAPAALRPTDAADAFDSIKDSPPPAEVLDRAAVLLDAAAKAEPTNARWVMGQSFVALHRRQGEACVDLCERAIDLEPDNAEWRYRLGNALFSLRINEVGMLSKGTVASKGKAAYEKAAALDPNHVGARVGLAMFYANAPGIAGGSEKKARETAEELLTIPGGAYQGSIVLATLAAKDKKWDEMNQRFAEAGAAATTTAEKAGVQRQQALALLQQKQDPSGALETARQIPMLGEPADSFTWYVIAMSQQELGDVPGAIEAYRKVLEINPDAQNSRMNLAVCLEKTADLEGALIHFDECLKRFPDGARADEAKTAAKKIRKELDKRAKKK